MFLWTKGAYAPIHAVQAHTRQRFYKEFGWTPDQLRSQRATDILEILAVWEVQAQIDKMRNRGKHGKSA